MKFTENSNLITNKISKNRIVLPPMDTLMGDNGNATQFHVKHYGAIASGGVGTIIVESTGISSEGRIRAGDLGLWNDDQIGSHKSIVDIVKKSNTVIGVQLNHAGSKSEIVSENRYGASLKYDYIDLSTLTLVDEDIMEDIINKFIDAAKRAKKAGYDFIELHGAHGYLLSELMCKGLNDFIKSDDILIRSKHVIELIKKLKEEVNIPLGIRISFDDHEENGMHVEDYEPLIKVLEEYVDYFHVSSGETTGRTNIPAAIKKAGTKIFRIPMAKKLKSFTTKPIIVVGNVSDRNDVLEVMENNIDFVAIGREHLLNPYLVVNSLLETEEIDREKYAWVNNPWFNFYDYRSLKDKISSK